MWGPGPALPSPRSDAVAVLGPDGDVAVLGGTTTTVSQLASTATSWVSGPDVDVALKSPGVVKYVQRDGVPL